MIPAPAVARGARTLPACRAPLGPRVVVVTGPDAHEHARQNASPGDLLLDPELLRRALHAAPVRVPARPDGEPGRDPARLVGLAAWGAALRRAVGLDEHLTVWLVHPTPRASQLAAYREAGYTVRASGKP